MSDHGRLVMDMLWPILGGNHTDADTWDEIAAALMTYGDKRYQQAIADVVEWLGSVGKEADEILPNGGTVARRFSSEITRRFGKGQDHG